MRAINQGPPLIDRAGVLRTNPETLELLWQRAQIIRLLDGRIAASGSNLAFFNAVEIERALEIHEFTTGDRYFLGLDPITRKPYFAWDTSFAIADSEDEQSEIFEKFGFSTVRELAPALAAQEMEMALHAIALSNWHRAHPMCPKCGGPTRVDLGGAARLCEVDKSQHHPRTDSAMIVLIKDRSDRILLGHQPIWPEGRYSTFAGFLEPGETFEQCVAREVLEEAGVTLTEITYLGSQPWPFPASIMIAFEAVTDNPEAARADGDEITDVQWFTRKQLLDAAGDGSLLLPPTISVARKMIEGWLGEPAPGGQTWR